MSRPTRRCPRLPGFDYAQKRTFFVTFCVSNRTPTFRNPASAQFVVDAILKYRGMSWYWVYAYCVMPNHVHVVLRLQGEQYSLGAIVGTIKRDILRRIRAAGNNLIWQEGFYDRIIRDYELSDEFVNYVLRNPIRAKLTSEYEPYAFAGTPDLWK